MHRHSRLRNERGAIIIHVAIALIALLCFAAIVVDHGVVNVARAQAQNAADAGALAGALALEQNLSDTTGATAAAKLFAGQQHHVWGSTTAAADVIVSPLPFPCPANAGGGNACIRVDVFRGVADRDGGAHTNVIGTYMAGIFGLNNQGVRATATAQVAAGNAVQCIKPWVVVDRWTDNTPPSASNPAGWDQNDTFTPGVDTYTPTGFSAETDTGLQLMLKGEGKEWSAGWSMEIDLNGGNGGNVYEDEIKGCPSYVPTVGIYDPSIPCNVVADTNLIKGCANVKTGVKQGPTVQGINYLVNTADPGAYWDTGTNQVAGGCTAAGTCVNGAGSPISPRIVPVALFNPQAYIDLGGTGNNGMARIVNIMGFFVEGMCSDVYPSNPPTWCGTGGDPNKTVVGRLMPYPGEFNGASGSAGPASFLKITRLVR
jgi:hypothetical protein